MTLTKLAKITVEALEDIKGRDIVSLDVRKLTSLFDRVVIATADSGRQASAMARNLQEKVKAQGGRVYGIEGEKTGDWILVDLGSIVVHVMQPTIRTHYNLEELWTPPKVPRKRAAKSVSTANEA
ncbi:MAG: iojap-like ribosome-associated protein [Betaproteobacteria bacterium]|nr:iojap-like ribosome-associated protein [Betaproteobacteria bacterium]